MGVASSDVALNGSTQKLIIVSEEAQLDIGRCYSYYNNSPGSHG